MGGSWSANCKVGGAFDFGEGTPWTALIYLACESAAAFCLYLLLPRKTQQQEGHVQSEQERARLNLWEDARRQLLARHEHRNNVTPDAMVHQENVENLDIPNTIYAELEELFPNRAQGAREETIRMLPTELYHERDRDLNTNANDERDKCSICLEHFEEGDEVRRLQCLHIFHKKEIDRWLRRSRWCPICRFNVDPNV